MLAMPKNNGYCVTWETGKFITVRGKDIPKRDDFYTKSKEKAEQKAKEAKSAGFKNVTISECIF